MRKTAIIVALIIMLFLFCCTASAQILSPVVKTTGVIGSDTNAFFIGKTSFSGSFSGYSLDTFFEDSTLEEIDAFPLIGRCELKDIESVKIIDVQSYNFSEFDISSFLSDGIVEYYDVNLITDDSPFALGVSNGSLTVDSNLAYAVSGLMNYEVSQQNIPFVFTLSSSDIQLSYSGDICPLMSFPGASVGTVNIENKNGLTLWDGDPTNKLFIIEDESFTIELDSAVSLFPLSTNDEFSSAEFSVTPADFGDVDISALINEVSAMTSEIGIGSISDFSDSISGFEDIISAVSQVANGAMILMNSNDTLVVGGSQQKLSGIGFARINSMDVTVESSDGLYETQISGLSRMILLSDHLYTVQAPESENGIAFPLAILAVWVLAIGLFILFRFYFKKEFFKIEIKNLKTFALIFHIIALVLAFILMDREISFQFGVSALDALLGQGFTLILGIFVVVELILWILGYFALSIPMRIISQSALKLFGIKKEGKGIAKGVGALFIWVFAAFYVKLLVNVILSFINPGDMFFA